MLDPTAAWASNNLCYLELRLGHLAEAQSLCEWSLRVAPALSPAQNNLALTHAAAGDFEQARSEFMAGGDGATEHYNVGIVQLAPATSKRPFDRSRRRSGCGRFSGRQGARPLGACTDVEGEQLKTTCHQQQKCRLAGSHFTELPSAPKTLEESGLSIDLLLQLALKTLHFAGDLTGAELSQPAGAELCRHRAGA